jgi:hypothetical protein
VVVFFRKNFFVVRSQDFCVFAGLFEGCFGKKWCVQHGFLLVRTW